MFTAPGSRRKSFLCQKVGLAADKISKPSKAFEFEKALAIGRQTLDSLLLHPTWGPVTGIGINDFAPRAITQALGRGRRNMPGVIDRVSAKAVPLHGSG